MSSSRASLPNEHVEIVKEYANNIAQSVEENFHVLGEINDESLKRLTSALNRFYKSLFHKKRGIFAPEKINKSLKKAPSLKKQSIAQNIYTKYSKGKGNPGKPRKLLVSGKQMRRHEREGIVSDLTNSFLIYNYKNGLEFPLGGDVLLGNAQQGNCSVSQPTSTPKLNINNSDSIINQQNSITNQSDYDNEIVVKQSTGMVMADQVAKT